jgi:hypothetical protein
MKTILWALQLLLTATVAIGEIKYYCVPPGTADVPENPDYLSWETAGTNIHEALKIANGNHPGQSVQRTLYVQSGTYIITNQLEINNAQFEIRSSKGPRAENEIDRDGTILCGGYPASTNRILHVKSDSFWSRYAVIRGFTITNGWVEGDGGGVYFSGARHDSVCIADCRITGNVAYRGMGGGIAFLPSEAGAGHITNCIVTGNIATNDFIKGSLASLNGSAVAIGHKAQAGKGAVSRNAGYRIFDTVISGNLSCGNAIASSALLTHNASVWIENCKITENRGLAMSGGNTADGAAVSLTPGSVMLCCTIASNHTENGTASAVHAKSASAITNCVLQCNTGATSFVADGRDGKYNNLPVILSNSSVIGKIGEGSVLVQTGNGFIMRNCLLMNATGASFTIASRSAALKNESEDVTVENCTLANNAKAVFCLGSKPFALVNTAVFGSTIRDLHQTSDAGAGISFTNCYFDTTAPRHLDDIASRPSTGCVFSDSAGFNDPASGDFSLHRKSPLRDAGLRLDWMDQAKDLAGKPRLLDSSGFHTANALPDIGCYEYATLNLGFSVIIK